MRRVQLVTFSVDGSDDNSTFNNIANAADQTVNLSTTVQTGVVYIPVDSIHRYIRVTATFAGAGSTPTITYSARLVAATALAEAKELRSNYELPNDSNEP